MDKRTSEMTDEKVLLTLSSPAWQDYTLLDSGCGKRLEQYGRYRLIRPEPEAIWAQSLSAKDWEHWDAKYEYSAKLKKMKWLKSQRLPTRWKASYTGLKFWVEISASRHVGVFPEQATHWDWVEGLIGKTKRQARVLNLFGYTGIASLAAARGGAHVTHVDSSQRAINIARENQALSGLDQYPIRWIKDDVLKFVVREARRNNKYDGILLDPPKFGRGPDGEVWEFYKFITNLLELLRQILSDQPLFIVLTAYGIKASSLTLQNAVSGMMKSWDGETTAGELILQEKSAGRMLSTAIFARWQASDTMEIL